MTPNLEKLQGVWCLHAQELISVEFFCSRERFHAWLTVSINVRSVFQTESGLFNNLPSLMPKLWKSSYAISLPFFAVLTVFSFIGETIFERWMRFFILEPWFKKKKNNNNKNQRLGNQSAVTACMLPLSLIPCHVPSSFSFSTVQSTRISRRILPFFFVCVCGFLGVDCWVGWLTRLSATTDRGEELGWRGAGGGGWIICGIWTYPVGGSHTSWRRPFLSVMDQGKKVILQ